MPGAISTNLKADKVASATAGNLVVFTAGGNIADAGAPPSSFDAAGSAAAVNTALTAHAANTANPHAVTAAQVGLGNVTNTSDAAKPVSTAQQTALNAKLDKSGGTMTGALVGSTTGADFSAGPFKVGVVNAPDGTLAISMGDGQFSDTSGFVSLDWYQRQAFDAIGSVSADYGIRQLVTATGIVTVDYSGAPNGSALLSFSGANMFVAGAKIYGYSTGTPSVYPTSGLLSDSSAKISHNWGLRGLYTAAGQTNPLIDYSGTNNASAALSFTGTQANFTGGITTSAAGTGGEKFGLGATIGTTTPNLCFAGGNGAIANNRGTAVGQSSKADGGATGQYTVAVGAQAVATGGQSTAIGATASATGANSFALGKGSSASGSSSIAIGPTAVTEGQVCRIGNVDNGTIQSLSLAGRASTAETNVEGVRWVSSFIDGSYATRKARCVWTIYDTAAREAIRVDANGTSAQIGIGGAVSGTNLLTVNGTSTFTSPPKLPVYTTATLPTPGTVGRIAVDSNGRKPGEGAGAGTGVLVYDDGTHWCIGDGTTVAA